jgi:transcriptional regulator with XRE-family HTH domain
VPGRDPESFVRDVTAQIGAARKAAGLTQDDAAKRYRTAVKNWQRIEAGQNITLHTLYRVAAVLGVSPESLVAVGRGPKRAEGKVESTKPVVAEPGKPKKKVNPRRGRGG